jgi:hypothetical protein
MITLHLRYTIDPNNLSDIKAYAEAELTPIRESGGKIVGYYLPTDFAGATNEAFGIIDFPSLAEYEVYRAKLAAHPLHKQYVEKLERSGALLSIQRISCSTGRGAAVMTESTKQSIPGYEFGSLQSAKSPLSMEEL